MTILQGKFPHLKSKKEYVLTLSPDGFTYENPGLPKITYKIHDITGCTCKKLENDSNGVSLTISAHVQMRDTRIKQSCSFLIDGESYHENLAKATKWKDAIYATMYSIPPREVGNIQTSSPLFTKKKKLMVFINPKSGTGIAKKIYKKHVKQLLDEADVIHEVFLTGWAKGAYAAVQKLNMGGLSGIVVISGDGLLYEIYNGLLQRDDWETALSFPIAILPGGSGNGLARSIGHVLGEPYIKNPVLVSTLNILNPVVTPMDLVLVHTPKERLISFLSVGLGLLSDIDIESECLRSIGEIRFTIWSLRRLLNLRRYRCKLSFKRVQNDPSRNRSLRFQSISQSTSVQNSLNTFHEPPRSRNCWSTYDQSFDLEQEKNKANNPDSSRKRTASILDEPIPEEWETIEDNFAFIYAVSQPYIGKTALISPQSQLNDGTIYMWIADAKASKSTLLKFLLSIDNGPKEDIGISCIPVSSFRIEPLGSKGNLTIDGELVDYGPVQAEVLPGKASIMTRPL